MVNFYEINYHEPLKTVSYPSCSNFILMACIVISRKKEKSERGGKYSFASIPDILSLSPLSG